MPYTVKDGIKADSSAEIARKIISLLSAEKCTVKESHNILSLAADIVNDSTVTVQEEKPVERAESDLFEQTRQQILDRRQLSELSHS